MTDIAKNLPQDIKTKIGSFIRPKTSFRLIEKILTVFYHRMIRAPPYTFFELIFDRGVSVIVDKRQQDIKFTLFTFYNQNELESQYTFFKETRPDRARISLIIDLCFLLQYFLLNFRIKRLDQFNVDYIETYQQEYENMPNRHIEGLNIKNALKTHEPSASVKKTIKVLNILRSIEDSSYFIRYE